MATRVFKGIMFDCMVFYAAFNSISVISRQHLTLFMYFQGFTSTRLGSEVSCPRTLPRKNPEDPVQLEPRTPGLRVKHITTEPSGTSYRNQILPRNSEEDHGRNISVKFHRNPVSSFRDV